MHDTRTMGKATTASGMDGIPWGYYLGSTSWSRKGAGHTRVQAGLKKENQASCKGPNRGTANPRCMSSPRMDPCQGNAEVDACHQGAEAGKA